MLSNEFREIRRVSTPWVAVTTADYRSSIKTLMAVRINGEDDPPAVLWDLIRGHSALNEPGQEAASMLGEASETAMAPAMLLQRALALPKETMLFVVFPKADMGEDPSVAQAIANVRDEFKRDRRTLVILGRSLSFATIIRDDIPTIDDPLPDDEAIKNIAMKIHEAVKKEPGPGEIDQAVEYCRGLTSFAVEEGIARKISRKGLDLPALAVLQRDIVEQSTDRALLFEKGKETFDDIGGLSQFKTFMGRLFAGPRPPKLLVRWDEIDKSVSAAASGAVADNTGVSQDMLKVLLTSMEDNDWTGAILVGGPGTGKTLASVCSGNTFGARTLVGDLGACRASLVGESERRIRTVMQVINAIGGKNVMFLATANRLDTLPPELQRRFSLGCWFFDTPTKDERASIWKIQASRFGIDLDQKIPNDNGWTGSDIRNCCRVAWLTASSLIEASQMITVAGKVSLPDIQKLRELADRSGFLSANQPGQYKKPAAASERAIAN